MSAPHTGPYFRLSGYAGVLQCAVLYSTLGPISGMHPVLPYATGGQLVGTIMPCH